MAGPSVFDNKVYKALERPEFLPDEFKSWMPKYLRYLSTLQVMKGQIPGVMGEPWTNVTTFTTPWRHYQTGSSAYGYVRYFKDYIGFVHLEGVAETTGTPTGPTIFNLPAGYRPSQALVFIQRATTVLGQPTDDCRIDIFATGDVQVIAPDNSKFTSGSGMSFAGIHFRAA
jgi:hypothetical protein